MRIPKYQMIKNELKKQLTSGKLENGDKFYTEAELMKLFHVSSITVIRALNDLVTEGYLLRRQGKGTFVAQAKRGKTVRFADLAALSIKTPKVTVLAITRGNEERILKQLALKEEQHYYCIEQLYKAQEVAYLYKRSYLPEQFINPNFPDLSYYESIAERLKQDFNFQLEDENSETIDEIRLHTPDDVAGILASSSSEPIVFQTTITYNAENNRVFEYVESYKKWDYYKIKLSSE